LTISDSVPYGAKYDAQSLLILLRLSDLLLIKEIHKVPLFTVIVDIVLCNPLSNNVRVTIEVIQVDFVQGKFELMLRLKSYASDLDDLHKSRRHRV